MNLKASKFYKTIYADPPWSEIGGGAIKRGADRYYNVMRTKDICRVPVWDISSTNCHLYLWVTNNYFQDGLKVMEAWGFRYVTMITWVKATKYYGYETNMFEAEKFDPLYKLQNPGLGQYYRGLTEHCLFGVKGRLPYKTKDGKRQQGCTALLAPRTKKHSQKPEEMREMIQRVSYPPYVELFARKPSPGWDVWGNEVESAEILTDFKETIDILQELK